MNIIISPQQCRAARAWLGWSQTTLATRAKIGLTTLRNFEQSKRIPDNHMAIQQVFEAAGLHFLFDDTRPIGLTID
jgi:DNA-binding transcriptional regulator YiaG